MIKDINKVNIVREIDKDLIREIENTYFLDCWEDSEFTFIDGGDRGEVYRYGNFAIKIGISEYCDEERNCIEDGYKLLMLDKYDYFPKIYAFTDNWVVMEFVDGITLSEIEDNIKDDYIDKILNIYDELYRNSIYMDDLHSTNILISKDNIKIVDVGEFEFGIDSGELDLSLKENYVQRENMKSFLKNDR